MPSCTARISTARFAPAVEIAALVGHHAKGLDVAPDRIGGVAVEGRRIGDGRCDGSSRSSPTRPVRRDEGRGAGDRHRRGDQRGDWPAASRSCASEAPALKDAAVPCAHRLAAGRSSCSGCNVARGSSCASTCAVFSASKANSSTASSRGGGGGTPSGRKIRSNCATPPMRRWIRTCSKAKAGTTQAAYQCSMTTS